MLTPARDADEAFVRLTPDLQELSDFIAVSHLPQHERSRLADMLADYFAGLARVHRRRGLRLVHDASRKSPADNATSAVQ